MALINGYAMGAIGSPIFNVPVASHCSAPTEQPDRKTESVRTSERTSIDFHNIAYI